jgi:hypothetical protein
MALVVLDCEFPWGKKKQQHAQARSLNRSIALFIQRGNTIFDVARFAIDKDMATAETHDLSSSWLGTCIENALFGNPFKSPFQKINHSGIDELRRMCTMHEDEGSKDVIDVL